MLKTFENSPASFCFLPASRRGTTGGRKPKEPIYRFGESAWNSYKTLFGSQASFKEPNLGYAHVLNLATA